MHGRTREFETLTSLIGAQYTSDQELKYPILALVSVVEVLNEYWEIVENQADEIDDDFQGRTIDLIEEVIHCWLVHHMPPEEELTESEEIAKADQLAAELREQIEAWGRDTGVNFKIDNLDQLLFKKEEKDGDE